jgi:hypothetical protein
MPDSKPNTEIVFFPTVCVSTIPSTAARRTAIFLRNIADQMELAIPLHRDDVAQFRAAADALDAIFFRETEAIIIEGSF